MYSKPMKVIAKYHRRRLVFSILGGLFLLIPLVIVGYFVWNGLPFDGSAPPRKVRWALDRAGAEQLLKDARTIAQKYGTTNLVEPAPGLEGKLNIPKETWPASINCFSPVRAELYSDRVSLVMKDTHSFYSEVQVFFDDRNLHLSKRDDDKFPDNSFIGGGSHESEYKIVKGIHWLTAKPFHGGTR
jgi:hypothetical protein